MRRRRAEETRNEKECIGSGGSDSNPPKGVLVIIDFCGMKLVWGGIFSHTSWESENQTLFISRVSLPFLQVYGRVDKEPPFPMR